MSHQRTDHFPHELPPDISDQRAFQTWLSDVISRLTANIDDPIIPEYHAAPEKPKARMLVFADGTNWNPGSGRGVYIYDTVGPTWRFLG